jgi:uncharacterized protein YndB with AHSA1/START domain
VATILLSTQTVTDLSIHKTLLISLDTQRAFEVFANELGDWWPLETHSQGGEKAETAILEGRLGGSMHEVTGAGETEAWATVKRWEPPQRIVLDWHVNPDKPTTDLEVRFAADGEGTRVDLYHRGWEAFGSETQAAHDEYNIGWDFVLGHYLIAVGTVKPQ